MSEAFGFECVGGKGMEGGIGDGGGSGALGCVDGGAWRWDTATALGGGLAPAVTVVPLLSA
jgi:hypothetical protein